MKYFYTTEKNIQILIALLKAHGIKKVVASPGGTNIPFIASIQNDDWFEIYSSIDERSAAYMGCGLAAESGEPVVISCTGATASRNYMPALTEAYYRKLPILALTSSQASEKIGHHIAQLTDRTLLPRDIANLSVQVPIIKEDSDEWNCIVKINQAILGLKHRGGGPTHINIETCYSRDFSENKLPEVRKIERVGTFDLFPSMPKGRIGIFVGSHAPWTSEEIEVIDKFCAIYDAVVFCDHTSNYKGKYRVLYSLVASQELYDTESLNLDLLIHIGEISGEYFVLGRIKANQVWRISEDGQIRDTFKKITYMFDMPEPNFFNHYADEVTMGKSDAYFIQCKEEYDTVYNSLPELPFSNIWMAKQTAPHLPHNTVLHLGILTSLRSWNLFEIPFAVTSFSNVGGFGIDGNLSSLLGASFVNKNKIYLGVFGDLSFFYDMNVLGNRHLDKNIRILLVNNGKGCEFTHHLSMGSLLKDDVNSYVAAAGHYGSKSNVLVKHYAEDLGFEYICATSKEEYLKGMERLIAPNASKPILLEAFTNDTDENKALKIVASCKSNSITSFNVKVKKIAKELIGIEGVKIAKNIINKALEYKNKLEA